jgi:hypothetical protein
LCNKALRMSPYHPFDGCDLVQNDRAVKVRFGVLWISIRTCSEGPQTALRVEMCMAQHLSLTALRAGCHSRPRAAVHVHLRMLRCGPSNRTFTHGAAFLLADTSVSGELSLRP